MSCEENITIEWRHRLQAEDHYKSGAGVRARLAWWMRGLADKLDGGRTVRLQIDTMPTLPPADVSACISRGLSHANRLLGDFTHQAACEEALKKESMIDW